MNDEVEDWPEADHKIRLEELPTRLLDLFSPHKRVRIAIGVGGSQVIHKPFRHLAFGATLDWGSGTEPVLHEVAHAIECPEERFGMEDSGLNAKRTRPGRAAWAVEREIATLAIQRRLHAHVAEPFRLRTSALGFNLVSGLGAWLEAVVGRELCWSEKMALSDIGLAAIGHAVDVIDESLPATESLLDRWHDRCRLLDARPSRILSDRLLEKRPVEPCDPLNDELRHRIVERSRAA